MIDAKTATQVWSYAPNPPIQTLLLGDVARMPNGNTVVVFGYAGVVHEVDPDGNLVQEMTEQAGVNFGFTERRTSLYGPPPR